MLANLVHSDATLFGGVLAQVQSRVDLLAKNSLESFRAGVRAISNRKPWRLLFRASRTLL